MMSKKEDHILISVVVPVYNVEKYLDQCIASIVAQTYKYLEIILVDDGSTDRSSAICDEWARKDERVRVMHLINSGVSVARNTGIKAASGKLLGFVDSDDYISPFLFEKAVEVFKQFDPDIVTFDVTRVNETGEVCGMVQSVKTNCILSKEEALEELLAENIKDYMWNKVFKTELFDGIEHPQGRCFEDIAIMYKLFLISRKIYSISEQLYNYRGREGSIVRDGRYSVLCDLFQARYTRHINLLETYPHIAALGFPSLTTVAFAVYDRGLWETVERTERAEATLFLQNHEMEILAQKKFKHRALFYRNRKRYNRLRLVRHRVARLAKKLLKKA